MKKLTLDFDALAVDTFETTGIPCDEVFAVDAISTAPCSFGAPCATIRGCTTG